MIASGLDALLATVTMPPRFPLRTVAVGKAGTQYAAHFAVQIVALTDPEGAEKIIVWRTNATAETGSDELKAGGLTSAGNHVAPDREEVQARLGAPDSGRHRPPKASETHNTLGRTIGNTSEDLP